MINGACARQKGLCGIFRIKTTFYGMPRIRDIGLGQIQGETFRDLNLQGYQIQLRDHFGYRVLHLKAGIHFEKVKIFFLIQKKFDSAHALVFYTARGLNRSCSHLCSQFIGHYRTGRFFHYFLIPALYRTIALPQMDDVSMIVCYYLKFDMTGAQDRLFQN